MTYLCRIFLNVIQPQYSFCVLRQKIPARFLPDNYKWASYINEGVHSEMGCDNLEKGFHLPKAEQMDLNLLCSSSELLWDLVPEGNAVLLWFNGPVVWSPLNQENMSSIVMLLGKWCKFLLFKNKWEFCLLHLISVALNIYQAIIFFIAQLK